MPASLGPGGSHLSPHPMLFSPRAGVSADSGQVADSLAVLGARDGSPTAPAAPAQLHSSEGSFIGSAAPAQPHSLDNSFIDYAARASEIHDAVQKLVDSDHVSFSDSANVLQTIIETELEHPCLFTQHELQDLPKLDSDISNNSLSTIVDISSLCCERFEALSSVSTLEADCQRYALMKIAGLLFQMSLTASCTYPPDDEIRFAQIHTQALIFSYVVPHVNQAQNYSPDHISSLSAALHVDIAEEYLAVKAYFSDLRDEPASDPSRFNVLDKGYYSGFYVSFQEGPFCLGSNYVSTRVDTTDSTIHVQTQYGVESSLPITVSVLDIDLTNASDSTDPSDFEPDDDCDITQPPIPPRNEVSDVDDASYEVPPLPERSEEETDVDDDHAMSQRSYRLPGNAFESTVAHTAGDQAADDGAGSPRVSSDDGAAGGSPVLPLRDHRPTSAVQSDASPPSVRLAGGADDGAMSPPAPSASVGARSPSPQMAVSARPASVGAGGGGAMRQASNEDAMSLGEAADVGARSSGVYEDGVRSQPPVAPHRSSPSSSMSSVDADREAAGASLRASTPLRSARSASVGAANDDTMSPPTHPLRDYDRNEVLSQASNDESIDESMSLGGSADVGARSSGVYEDGVRSQPPVAPHRSSPSSSMSSVDAGGAAAGGTPRFRSISPPAHHASQVAAGGGAARARRRASTPLRSARSASVGATRASTPPAPPIVMHSGSTGDGAAGGGSASARRRPTTPPARPASQVVLDSSIQELNPSFSVSAGGSARSLSRPRAVPSHHASVGAGASGVSADDGAMSPPARAAVRRAGGSEPVITDLDFFKQLYKDMDLDDKFNSNSRWGRSKDLADNLTELPLDLRPFMFAKVLSAALSNQVHSVKDTFVGLHAALSTIDSKNEQLDILLAIRPLLHQLFGNTTKVTEALRLLIETHLTKNAHFSFDGNGTNDTGNYTDITAFYTSPASELPLHFPTPLESDTLCTRFFYALHQGDTLPLYQKATACTNDELPIGELFAFIMEQDPTFEPPTVDLLYNFAHGLSAPYTPPPAKWLSSFYRALSELDFRDPSLDIYKVKRLFEFCHTVLNVQEYLESPEALSTHDRQFIQTAVTNFYEAKKDVYTFKDDFNEVRSEQPLSLPTLINGLAIVKDIKTDVQEERDEQARIKRKYFQHFNDICASKRDRYQTTIDDPNKSEEEKRRAEQKIHNMPRSVDALLDGLYSDDTPLETFTTMLQYCDNSPRLRAALVQEIVCRDDFLPLLDGRETKQVKFWKQQIMEAGHHVVENVELETLKLFAEILIKTSNPQRLDSNILSFLKSINQKYPFSLKSMFEQHIPSNEGELHSSPFTFTHRRIFSTYKQKLEGPSS
ncbi:MAG: hypothetical protein VW378_05160 [bacterium]